MNGKWRLKILWVDVLVEKLGWRDDVGTVRCGGSRGFQAGKHEGQGLLKSHYQGTQWETLKSPAHWPGPAAPWKPLSPPRLPIPTCQHCLEFIIFLGCWPASCQVLWVEDQTTYNCICCWMDLPYFQYIVSDFKNIFTTTLSENRFLLL